MERNIAYIALFAALTAALGFIPIITLAFGVPITAQTLGVMLSGCILGSWRGGLASLLLIALIALGVPLLAGGRGGLGLFFSPSGGFLIGWPIGAFVCGLIMEHFRKTHPFAIGLIASVIGGIIVVYIPGIFGMYLVLEQTLVHIIYSVMIFVPGDLIKAIISSLIIMLLCKYRPESVISRNG